MTYKPVCQFCSYLIKYRHWCDRKAGSALRQVQDISIDRLEEICEAERDGRLVILPCKVDSDVYIITTPFITIPRQVKSLKYGELLMKVRDLPWGEGNIFLTRAEAEAALKRRGGI